MSDSPAPEPADHERAIDCPAEAFWQSWLNGHDDETGFVTNTEVEFKLEQHLATCLECQRKMDSVLKSDPFVQTSRKALRSSGLASVDWDAPADHSVTQLASQSANEAFGELTGGDVNQTHDSDSHSDSAMTRLVRTLFAPTDDPRSLGRLGRFEVLGVIGAGGMGVVLKARSMDMDRVVAIKIPQPHLWQSTDTLATLEREARSAAAVVHPNVITIYHVDRYRNVPFLVMPYLSGPTLQQRIRDHGALPLPDVLRIIRQLAGALDAAHTCGVVHRDIKPANILLGKGTERAVLSDFGLAKIQSDATCTATGTFAGTPIYLSPEQASGEGAGPAGDLYSLGTVMWTMLAGRPPFDAMHAHAIVRMIADGQHPDLRDHVAESLPDWAFQFVARLHDPVPANRPSAARVVNWVSICEKMMAGDKSVRIPEALRCQPVSPRRRWLVNGMVSITILTVLLTSLWGCIAWVRHRESGNRENGDSVVGPGRKMQADTPQADPKPLAMPTEPSVPDETREYLYELQQELDELRRIELLEWQQQLDELSRTDSQSTSNRKPSR